MVAPGFVERPDEGKEGDQKNDEGKLVTVENTVPIHHHGAPEILLDHLSQHDAEHYWGDRVAISLEEPANDAKSYAGGNIKHGLADRETADYGYGQDQGIHD